MTEFDSYGNVKLIHVNMPQRKTEMNKLQGIYDQLISEYGEQFTAKEAQYAIDHLDD